MDNKKTGAANGGERIAKVIARVGLCSRRQAEAWISEGRIEVNGKVLKSPAFNVMASDNVVVDGKQLPNREPTRMWLFHKPSERMVTENDPDGRRTIFDDFSNSELPRVVTVGRLDFNTEGLLMLTNDGGLKRVLELPSTGWVRRYRVRAFGNVEQAALDKLKNGITIDGVKYGEIEATLERVQGRNVWLLVALREGKNREIKVVLGALGLEVNRLIRISYGPFQLGDLPVGDIQEVKRKILRDQLGKKLVDASGANFDDVVASRPVLDPKARMSKKGGSRQLPNKQPRRPLAEAGETATPFYKKPEKRNRPVEEHSRDERPARRGREQREERPREQSAERQKRVFFGDGRSEKYTAPPPKRGDKRDDGDKKGKFGDKRSRDDTRGNRDDDKRGRDDNRGGRDDKRGSKPPHKAQTKRRI